MRCLFSCLIGAYVSASPLRVDTPTTHEHCRRDHDQQHPERSVARAARWRRARRREGAARARRTSTGVPPPRRCRVPTDGCRSGRGRSARRRTARARVATAPAGVRFDPHDPDREQHQDDRTDAGEARHRVDRSRRGPRHTNSGAFCNEVLERLLLDGAGVPSPARVPEQVDGSRARRRSAPPASIRVAGSVAIPTTIAMVRLTPENGQCEHEHEARPTRRAVGTVRRRTAMSSASRPSAIGTTNVIWNTLIRSSHPAPSTMKTAAAPVARSQSTPYAEHQAPQQVGGEQVGDDEHEEVRRVGADAEHREERPVDRGRGTCSSARCGARGGRARCARARPAERGSPTRRR